MQIKSTMRYHLISIQHDCNNKKKKKKEKKYWQRCGEIELLYSVGENGSCCSHHGKLKHRITI